MNEDDEWGWGGQRNTWNQRQNPELTKGLRYRNKEQKELGELTRQG